MARAYNRDEFTVHKHALLPLMKRSVFIYPTDTIYGIGCNALDASLVNRVRAIKQRHDLPFSVIAPSKEWIIEHCVVDERAEEWLAKLPGPYTLILKLKNPDEFPVSVNNNLDTLGVRIPNNWFGEVVEELGVPIITTSANLTGDNHMTSLDDLHPVVKKNVDLIIYTGELKGKPSTIVRLDKPGEELVKR